MLWITKSNQRASLVDKIANWECKKKYMFWARVAMKEFEEIGKLLKKELNIQVSQIIG